MRVVRSALAFALLGAFHSGPAEAQAVGVMVDSTGSDLVGMRLATRVRETFARSPLFNLVFEESKALIKVELVTLEPAGTEGHMTVYSEVITVPNTKGPNFYLNNVVGACGMDKVDACADYIKSNVDEQVAFLRKAAQAQR